MEHPRARLRFLDMKTLLGAIVAVPLFTLAMLTPFPRIPPYLPVSTGAAVIMLTGSTNTSGYRIVVTRGGSAEYIDVAGRSRTAISSQLAEKLFADLHAAAPLGELPARACMKSASFGTSLFVYWNHERSPDLSCSGDKRGALLANDASAVATALKVRTSGGGVLRPLMPGELHRPLPSPS